MGIGSGSADSAADSKFEGFPHPQPTSATHIRNPHPQPTSSAGERVVSRLTAHQERSGLKAQGRWGFDASATHDRLEALHAVARHDLGDGGCGGGLTPM